MGYPPVIVHDCDQEADLLYVLRRHVEDNGLVINWIQSVPLCGRLPLFQSAAFTH